MKLESNAAEHKEKYISRGGYKQSFKKLRYCKCLFHHNLIYFGNTHVNLLESFRTEKCDCVRERVELMEEI